MQDSGDSFWDDGSGLFDDPAVLAALDARAADDVAHGKLISHQAVLYWLRCWGDDAPIRTPWHG